MDVQDPVGPAATVHLDRARVDELRALHAEVTAGGNNQRIAARQLQAAGKHGRRQGDGAGTVDDARVRPVVGERRWCPIAADGPTAVTAEGPCRRAGERARGVDRAGIDDTEREGKRNHHEQRFPRQRS